MSHLVSNINNFKNNVFDFFSGIEPDWVSAGANIGLLITAIIAASVAKKSWKTQEKSIYQANRPMMLAHYIPSPDSDRNLLLEISNIGKTIARDVEITFDPPLNPNDEKVREEAKYQKIPYMLFSDNNKFKTWVPGQKLNCLFWQSQEDDIDFNISSDGIESTQKIIIEYYDETNSDNAPFKEIFTLNPKIGLGTVVGLPPTEKEKSDRFVKAVIEYMKNPPTNSAVEFIMSKTEFYDEGNTKNVFISEK